MASLTHQSIQNQAGDYAHIWRYAQGGDGYSAGQIAISCTAPNSAKEAAPCYPLADAIANGYPVLMQGQPPQVTPAQLQVTPAQLQQQEIGMGTVFAVGMLLAGGFAVARHLWQRREVASYLPILPPAAHPVTKPFVTGCDRQSADISDEAVPTEASKRLAYLLSQPENAWITRLINPPAVLIKGPQGSGKTTFTAAVLLLRILYGHSAEVADPHYHQNADKWFSCLVSPTYQAIGDRIDAYFERLKTRTQASQMHTSVWDEFTNYSERVPNKRVSEFMPSILSDARKANERPIIIAHSDAKGMLGDSSRSGTHQMKLEQLITVHLNATRDQLGEPFPSGNGWLRGLDYDGDGMPIITHIEIPKWLNPATLIDWFPELGNSPQIDHQAQPFPISDISKPEPRRNSVSDIRNQLEMLYINGFDGSISPPKSFREMPEMPLDCLQRIREMRNAGLNQTQIIAIEWGAKPGNNQPYRDAVIAYKKIVSMLNQEGGS